MPATYRFEVHSRIDCVAGGRAARDMAIADDWPAPRAEELRLVVLELATNAVRHGGGGHCQVTVDPLEWTVRVEDSGAGFPDLVIEDAGRTDGMGAAGRLEPADGPRRGLGSGLACVRRFSMDLVLKNRTGRGGIAYARQARQGRKSA